MWCFIRFFIVDNIIKRIVQPVSPYIISSLVHSRDCMHCCMCWIWQKSWPKKERSVDCSKNCCHFFTHSPVFHSPDDDDDGHPFEMRFSFCDKRDKSKKGSLSWHETMKTKLKRFSTSGRGRERVRRQFIHKKFYGHSSRLCVGEKSLSSSHSSTRVWGFEFFICLNGTRSAAREAWVTVWLPH